MKSEASNTNTPGLWMNNLMKYQGKVFVIKYGGAAMSGDKLKDSFAGDVVMLTRSNIKTIIVHGGGKEITELSRRLNIPVKFVDGLRYTDAEAMDAVKMILAGKINKEIVTEIIKKKGCAAGISGIDANLFKVQKLTKYNTDLGFVGEVTDVNTTFLNLLLSENIIPVIAPIGISGNGEAFNINADHAASVLASKLKAEKLIFVSDVPGIAAGNDLIKSISLDKANELIRNGVIINGMIPKIRSAFDAIEAGVGCVHIIDGRIEHSLLKEMTNNEVNGTVITH